MIHASQYPTLVLNADFQPLSYFPLSLWNWQDALKAVFRERVHVVAEYQKYARAATIAMPLPSVVSLKKYIPQPQKPAFTRLNVFLRDSFTCQYCRQKLPSEKLTFDHVIPRTRGGSSNWNNVVTACQYCNLAKGSRLPNECDMHPRTPPQQPTSFTLQKQGRKFPHKHLHESWMDFLYWDSELDSQT